MKSPESDKKIKRLQKEWLAKKSKLLELGLISEITTEKDGTELAASNSVALFHPTSDEVGLQIKIINEKTRELEKAITKLIELLEEI